MPLKFSSLDFLLRRMAMGKTGCLDRLSNDVLVDQVFIYLTIADILRLRRVRIVIQLNSCLVADLCAIGKQTVLLPFTTAGSLEKALATHRLSSPSFAPYRPSFPQRCFLIRS